MSTPIPGTQISVIEDFLNFYLSQLRITVERAFGILVHRWGILRRPLLISILKVPAIVTYLMRLHNFCTDNDSRKTPSPRARDERNTRRITTASEESNPPIMVLDEHGRPVNLMGSGHHFLDKSDRSVRRPTPRGDVRTPMCAMIQQIADLDLRRPSIK